MSKETIMKVFKTVTKFGEIYEITSFDNEQLFSSYWGVKSTSVKCVEVEVIPNPTQTKDVFGRVLEEVGYTLHPSEVPDDVYDNWDDLPF